MVASGTCRCGLEESGVLITYPYAPCCSAQQLMEKPHVSEDLEGQHNVEGGLVMIALYQLTHMKDDISCMIRLGTLGCRLQEHKDTQSDHFDR